MTRALRVGAVAFAGLAVLLFLQSILLLLDGHVYAAVAWGVTGAGGVAMAWLMRHVAARGERAPARP